MQHLTNMQIDLEKFQRFLTKKNRKEPFNRPASCFPQNYKKQSVYLQPSREACLLKKPDNVCCVMRPPSYEKRVHKHSRSVSVCDPSNIQEKLLKLKIGNTFGIKELNPKNSNFLNSKYYFKQAISNRIKEYSKQQVENARHSYQKKKLRVVKGKTNAYRQKLQQNDQKEDFTLFGVQGKGKSVSIVGTKIL